MNRYKALALVIAIAVGAVVNFVGNAANAEIPAN